MATETLSPSSLDVQTNLSGTVSNIQDDPDSPDGNWLTASSTSTDCVCRVSFPTPSGNLTTGAGLQEFRVLYRNNPTGRTADNLSIFLYENGSVVGSALLSQTDPADNTVYSGTWNASALSNIDGSLVECHITITADTAPTPQIASGDIGAIEWNVVYDTAATNYERTLSSNVDANDPQTRGIERTRALLNAMLGISDGDVQRLLSANYTTANNVTAVDLLIRTLTAVSQTYNRILQSNAVINDTLMRTQILDRLTQSQISISDAIQRDLYLFYFRTLQSGVAINDNLIREIARLYSVVLTSNINTSDDLQRVTDSVRLLLNTVTINDTIISSIVGLISRVLHDNIEINDSLISLVVRFYARLLQDNVDLNDAVAREVAIGLVVRILQDAASASDTDFLTFFERNFTARDTVDAYDLLTRTVTGISIYARTLSDYVSIQDLISIALSGVYFYNRTLSDNIESTDVLSRELLLDRSLSSTISLYDLIQREWITYVIVSRILSDDVITTDKLSRTLQLLHGLRSYIDAIDSVVNETLYVRNTFDAILDIQDSVAYLTYTELLRILSDDINLTDRLSKEQLNRIGRTLTASVVVLDSLLREAEFFHILQDNLNLSDTVSYAVITHLLNRLLADSIDIDDTVLRTILRNAHVINIIYELMQRDDNFNVTSRKVVYTLTERKADSKIKRI